MGRTGRRPRSIAAPGGFGSGLDGARQRRSAILSWLEAGLDETVGGKLGTVDEEENGVAEENV